MEEKGICAMQKNPAFKSFGVRDHNFDVILIPVTLAQGPIFLKMKAKIAFFSEKKDNLTKFLRFFIDYRINEMPTLT